MKLKIVTPVSDVNSENVQRDRQKKLNNLLSLAARVLLSALFLMSGINKILNPADTQQYMASYGMPLTGLFLMGAIALELAGGLSVLLGYKARWGAIALIIFLIPATLIFHTNFADQMQTIQFMKNLAILGGLLMIVQSGSGDIAIKRDRAL
ncbi:MAG: DoxX family protein [Gloeocapsa sp. UFS-A4-WI-NPMV-4B04]|jgi:putative oxidoreductase|nr:DoxX family protein [Gloeocapsa sp. UFS-A4-WI-NPMV-4B04]